MLPFTATNFVLDQFPISISPIVNPVIVSENCAVIWIPVFVGLLLLAESVTVGAIVSCTITVLVSLHVFQELSTLIYSIVYVQSVPVFTVPLVVVIVFISPALS